jgi:ApbE superfamily uncharacterized protein (UPF0280 family)
MINQLAATLKKVSNKEIEVTIITENKFSFSFDGEDATAEMKLTDYFKKAPKSTVSSEYDEICDTTCIWVELN